MSETLPPGAVPAAAADPVPPQMLSDKLEPHFPGTVGATARDGIENVHVSASFLAEAAKRLRDDHGFIRFIDLTVIDDPERDPRFEVSVLLYSMNEKRWIRLKARTNEKVPSLTPVFVGAHNYEREAFDLFGVVFEGHPSLTRIMMPDGWVGYPLRKDDGIFNEPVDFTVTRDTFRT